MSDYLESFKKQFEYYKILGNRTLIQLPDDKSFWKFNENSNSFAIILNHLSGNMLSGWANFLTADGEKQWGIRDLEFESPILSRTDLIKRCNEGWECLFSALNSLTEANLQKEIYIRNQGHTVVEAINHQLAHYPYHIGQMVFVGKMKYDHEWISLSIPK